MIHTVRGVSGFCSSTPVLYCRALLRALSSTPFRRARIEPAPNSPRRSFSCFRSILCVLPLLFILAPAHAYQQSVEPKFFYRTGTAAVPAEDTVQQEWADEQAYMNRTTTSPQGTWVVTVSNLHPYTSGGHGYTLNGTWDQQSYDLSQCGYFPNGQVSCSNFPDWDYIQTYYACPAGFGPSEHIDSPTSHTLSCQKAQPDVQPPPKCNSCIGNPVYASTGQKIQVETDYTGLPGLTFERTYRSNVGFFASSTSTAFIDNSLPDGSTTYNCLPGYYVHPWTQVQTPYCFRYITLAQPNYQLATNDGRYLQFSGSNTAVTQNADINERVTQVTNSSGAIEWHVKREDDSTEIYNAKGVLTQTVLRNGQVVTYTYSDANTPASVAPRPGLLLTKTDAFGHTLSWLYDSLGHVAQMTDPAGGVYQYSYDTVGNLAAVTYPDSSGKSYLYNESAYTGGTNLPQALTGITDESGARFATFKYDSIGRGTSTEHAGGVEKYTLSYQSSSPGATATVIGPLGATRTYRFQSILSYARDSSQTQPAPSGSGTVSTAYTYDANGNVASTTDFVGNRNCYPLRSYSQSRDSPGGRTRACYFLSYESRDVRADSRNEAAQNQHNLERDLPFAGINYRG